MTKTIDIWQGKAHLMKYLKRAELA